MKLCIPKCFQKLANTDTFIHKSFFYSLFTKYGYKENHRICSWIFTLIYGYFVSQIVKTSGFLATGSYYKQSAVGFIYDLLNMLAYSVCLYYISSLNKSQNLRYQIDCLLYWILFVSSIIVFAGLGEISWLKTLAITWGFWERLSNKAVNFLSISSAVLLIFITYQIRKACLEDRFNKLFGPTLITLVVYSLSWIILSQIENADSILHLHHAFLAAVFSFWFSNWDNISAFLWHAITMGIWVEGWNMYGTQEVYIFMEAKNGSMISLIPSVIIVGIFTIILLLGLRHSTHYYKKKNSIQRSASFPGVQHQTIEMTSQ